MSKLYELLREYQELPEFGGIELSSVHQRGGWDSTPLHLAIYRERLDEVEVILDAGADVNARGEYGETPLHVAVNVGNPEIVECLLRAGARRDAVDDRQVSVSRLAEVLGNQNILKQISEWNSTA